MTCEPEGDDEVWAEEGLRQRTFMILGSPGIKPGRLTFGQCDLIAYVLRPQRRWSESTGMLLCKHWIMSEEDA